MSAKATKGKPAKTKAEGQHDNAQKISELLGGMKACLESIKPLSGLTVEDAAEWAIKNKIVIPWTAFLPKRGTVIYERLRFATAPPTTVTVVGSFLLNTVVGTASADLAIEMPPSLLKDRDDVNYCYGVKRAFYLATVAQVLGELEKLRGTSTRWLWTPFRGHLSRPVLTIIPEGLNVEINLHITLPKEHFKFYRLAPTKNMVRAALILGSESQAGEAEELQNAPTPIYNSLILVDMLMVEHLKLIHAECKSIPTLREAIKLGKAWLRQWVSSEQAFAFSGFQFSMLAVYLSKLRRFDPVMSELQLFKIILHFLAEYDWSKPLIFPGCNPPPNHTAEYVPEVYERAFAASLVEPIAGMNLYFDLSVDCIKEVTRQAQLALETLARGDLESLFIYPQSHFSHFDSYFIVKGMSWMPDRRANIAHYQNQLVPENARLKMLSRKLSFALGNRVKSISINPILPPTSISKAPNQHFITKYGIGLTWNGADAQKLVELGPTAGETEEVRQFRAFWRERAELRRFPDGSVREAVAWESFKMKRYAVIPDIISFVMETHFGTDQVECLDLSVAFAWKSNIALYGSLPEVLLKFSKAMKSINELPLAVTRCEPISSASRLTSVSRVPTINEVDKGELMPVTEVLVYLENSSRWPDEYYGLQYAKQAFSLQICHALEDRFGLETSLTEKYFDICMEKYVLRCYIHYEREAALWCRQGFDPAEHIILHEERPKHARAIAGLSQGSFAYGVVCRFFKQWVSSQMYALQLPEELLELLVASVFVNYQQPPRSAISGLVRVLELLTRHPWERQPLLIDFERDEGSVWNPEMATTAFEATEAAQRPLLCIAPSYQVDGNCCVWSLMASITPKELLHLKNSAVETIKAIESFNPAWERLLSPDRKRFSLLAWIELDDLRLPKAQKLINRHGRPGFMQSLPGFDPVGELLKRLRGYCEENGVQMYYDLLNHGSLIGFSTDEAFVNLDQVAGQLKELSGGLISKILSPKKSKSL